jgi:hypothetical protein
MDIEDSSAAASNPAGASAPANAVGAAFARSAYPLKSLGASHFLKARPIAVGEAALPVSAHMLMMNDHVAAKIFDEFLESEFLSAAYDMEIKVDRSHQEYKVALPGSGVQLIRIDLLGEARLLEGGREIPLKSIHEVQRDFDAKGYEDRILKYPVYLHEFGAGMFQDEDGCRIFTTFVNLRNDQSKELISYGPSPSAISPLLKYKWLEINLNNLALLPADMNPTFKVFLIAHVSLHEPGVFDFLLKEAGVMGGKALMIADYLRKRMAIIKKDAAFVKELTDEAGKSGEMLVINEEAGKMVGLEFIIANAAGREEAARKEAEAAREKAEAAREKAESAREETEAAREETEAVRKEACAQAVKSKKAAVDLVLKMSGKGISMDVMTELSEFPEALIKKLAGLSSDEAFGVYMADLFSEAAEALG